jgi:rhamnosyltransferase
MTICALITLYKPNFDKLKKNISEILRYSSKVYLLNNEKEGIHIDFGNKVSIIENHKNIGLSRAINIGVQRAQTEGFDYAILFDQDSILTKEMFDCLELQFMKINKEYSLSCIGPSLNVRGNLLPIPNWNKRRKIKQYDCYSVYSIITSGMLFNIGIYNSVGGFNEWFPVDFCDFVFCWKCIQKKYNIYQSTTSYILHEIGNGGLKIKKRTIHFHSFYRNYFLVRDTLNICFRRRETPFKIRFRFAFLLPFRMFLIVLLLPNRTLRLKMYLLGFLDFLSNKHGFGSIDSLLEAK